MFWGITIAAVGFIALIFCAKKQKTNPAMQPIAIACFLVLLAGVGICISKNMNDDGFDLDSERNFTYSKSARAGKVLSSKFGGKRVIFMVAPDNIDSEFTVAKIEAFKEAYGSDNVTVVAPGNAGVDIGIEGVNRKHFEEVLTQNSDAEVIVSDIGLPADWNKLTVFRNKNSKIEAIFLLDTGILDFKDLKSLCEKDKFAGYVTSRKKSDFSITADRDDLQKAFDVRYLVVSKDSPDDRK